MPTKKKKYNARFPPARIKKIMQSNEEVGKVAAPVPVIISRALELFVDTLMTNVNSTLTDRGARTMTPGHLKLCIHSEPRFDFLKDLVGDIPDLQGDVDVDQNVTEMPPTSTATSSQQGHPRLITFRPFVINEHQLSRKSSYDPSKPKPQASSSHRYVDDVDMDSDTEGEENVGEKNEESQKVGADNDLSISKETHPVVGASEEEKVVQNNPATLFHMRQDTKISTDGQTVPNFTITPISTPSSSSQANGNFSMSKILENGCSTSNVLTIGGAQLEVDEDYDA